jgi:NADPH-dependent ferric siderophore reductase
VRDVERLTPQLTRVVAAGDLQSWKAEIPGGHFKLFVPDDGAEGGGEGAGRAMRTYTARACDPEAGLLTIDFAIHAEGPATSWAKTARPGEELQISGMARPGYAPGEGAQSTVFIADQSALPAVAAIAEALPVGYRALALIEIPAETERIELDTAADLQLEWIIESGAPCERLVAAALALAPLEGQVEYWVGCEADAMRAIRRNLVHERGVNPRALHTRAYWKQSVANHPDHDTGDDVD